jgi:hypothetical protein
MFLVVPRECIFCGGGPVSQEHVWSQWLLDLVPAGNLLANRGDRAWPAKTIELTVGAVCQDRCNGGWMSRLENACKDIITPMVNGEAVTLDREQRARLSAWAVKTAMVAEHTLPGEPFWRPEERRVFAEWPHTPPGDETLVVSAKYVGGRYRALLMPGRREMKRMSGEGRSAPMVRAVIVVGNLVLQVDADRYREVTGRRGWPWPNPDSTVLLWPPGGNQTAAWPRPGFEAFNDDALQLFVHGRKASESDER